MNSAVRVLRGDGFARDAAEELQRAGTGTVSADSVKRHFAATGRLLKGDPHSAVYLAQLVGRHCYCKLFLAKSSRQRLLFRLNRSRGQRSFDVAQRLHALALPVPEPLVHQQNVRQGPPPKGGTDPSTPYFEDLSEGVSIPDDTWGPIFRQHNHFSGSSFKLIPACKQGSD